MTFGLREFYRDASIQSLLTAPSRRDIHRDPEALANPS
jgi:hypothetical protein